MKFNATQAQANFSCWFESLKKHMTCAPPPPPPPTHLLCTTPQLFPFLYRTSDYTNFTALAHGGHAVVNPHPSPAKITKEKDWYRLLCFRHVVPMESSSSLRFFRGELRTLYFFAQKRNDSKKKFILCCPWRRKKCKQRQTFFI